MTDKDIIKYSNSIDYNKKLLKNHNGLLITDEQLEILNRNGIKIEECGSITELLFIIDEVLDEVDDKELEWVAETLQERNYYENTKK